MPTIQEQLRKNLTPELYTQVMDALGDDFDFDLVPRSRLNKVIKQRNDLREQLAGDPQTSGVDDDDDGVGAPAAKNGKGNTGVDVKELQKQHKTEMSNLAIRYSALDKLRAAKAKDPELILKAGLLDTKGAKVSDDGVVTWPTGENDPFEALTKNESYKYLFDGVSTPTGDDGKGKDTGTGSGKGSDDGVPAGTGKDSGAGADGGKNQLDAMLDKAMGMTSGITPVE
jgi:hypothetical protein